MTPPVIIGQKIIWRSTGKTAIVHSWKEEDGEYLVKVSPSGPFWYMWFFKIWEDGNDILKGML